MIVFIELHSDWTSPQTFVRGPIIALQIVFAKESRDRRSKSACCLDIDTNMADYIFLFIFICTSLLVVADIKILQYHWAIFSPMFNKIVVQCKTLIAIEGAPEYRSLIWIFSWISPYDQRKRSTEWFSNTGKTLQNRFTEVPVILYECYVDIENFHPMENTLIQYGQKSASFQYLFNHFFYKQPRTSIISHRSSILDSF